MSERRQYLWWEPKPPDPQEEAALAARRARLASKVPAPVAPPLPPVREKKPTQRALRLVPCPAGWWLVGSTYAVRGELAELGLEWSPSQRSWFVAEWQGKAVRKWLARR